MCLGYTSYALYLCGVKTKTMKKLIKQLFFDKELVEAIKITNATRELLYVQLINGRITMKEYIAATRR